MCEADYGNLIILISLHLVSRFENVLVLTLYSTATKKLSAEVVEACSVRFGLKYLYHPEIIKLSKVFLVRETHLDFFFSEQTM